jgi:hypothetical protein
LQETHTHPCTPLQTIRLEHFEFRFAPLFLIRLQNGYKFMNREAREKTLRRLFAYFAYFAVFLLLCLLLARPD